jgi:hypothetical protein
VRSSDWVKVVPVGSERPLSCLKRYIRLSARARRFGIRAVWKAGRPDTQREHILLIRGHSDVVRNLLGTVLT